MHGPGDGSRRAPEGDGRRGVRSGGFGHGRNQWNGTRYVSPLPAIRHARNLANSSHFHPRSFSMPSTKKVRVAIVGLGFGAEFIPIYQAHPNAELVAVCRRNKAEMDKTADKYKIAKRFT